MGLLLYLGHRGRVLQRERLGLQGFQGLLLQTEVKAQVAFQEVTVHQVHQAQTVQTDSRGRGERVERLGQLGQTAQAVKVVLHTFLGLQRFLQRVGLRERVGGVGLQAALPQTAAVV